MVEEAGYGVEEVIGGGMSRKCCKCRKEFEPETRYIFMCSGCVESRWDYIDDVRMMEVATVAGGGNG